MNVPKFSTVSLSVLVILGCSSGKDADPPPPAPPAKTVFDPLTQDLKKAQAVQQAVDANTDHTRDAVDHQERGDATP
jgi:hypothetical protein